MPSVVPANCASQFTDFSQPRRSAAQIGYRALREAGCPQHTLATHPSPRGSPNPKEAEARASLFLGQLRGGKARSLQGSRPNPRSTPEHILSSKSERLSSQKPSSTTTTQQALQHDCPAGFQVYMKEVKEIYQQEGPVQAIVSEDGGHEENEDAPVFCPKGKWIRAGECQKEADLPRKILYT